MPRTVSARLEGSLEERYNDAEAASAETNKSAFLRSVVDDGLEAKDRDLLDAIDPSDELREAVEAAQKEGEPLDDTVRRLLRDGVNASDDRQRTVWTRSTGALAVGSVTGSVALVYAFSGPALAGGLILLYASLVAFDDVYLRAVGKIVNATETADEIRDVIDETREERAEGGTESERET